MTFSETFPTVAMLLGGSNASVLDRHAFELSNKSDEDAVSHFKSCPVGPWCALNTTHECRSELESIEASLVQILNSEHIDQAKLRQAFSRKAVNPDQYDQLFAEIAAAATAAMRATLLDLEWMTGKQNFDADVRMEVNSTPVNFEVTLRIDSWANDVAVHMEDILDENGNQIREYPAAKSRRTLTDLQRSDLADSGLTSPIRVSDVIEARQQTPRTTVFVTDPKDFPKNEERKVYCADGDNPAVESRNLQRCIQDKAQKFNADGFHVVVLATLRPGFPSENSVFDAVFGQNPHIKHHGLFESGLYNEICGVIYLPVYQHLSRLHGQSDQPSLTRFFLNHNSEVPLPVELRQAIADAFEATIRTGWVDKSTDSAATKAESCE